MTKVIYRTAIDSGKKAYDTMQHINKLMMPSESIYERLFTYLSANVAKKQAKFEKIQELTKQLRVELVDFEEKLMATDRSIDYEATLDALDEMCELVIEDIYLINKMAVFIGTAQGRLVKLKGETLTLLQALKREENLAL